MKPFADYKKERAMFELFRLIKNGEVISPEELADLFEKDIKTIRNYVKELNENFLTDIRYQRSSKGYCVYHDGILGMLKYIYPISAGDINVILTMLISTDLEPTRKKIIREFLIKHLSENEARMLRSRYPFEHINTNACAEFETINIIRKAIDEGKKISFEYRSASSEVFKSYRAVPYGFACEFGKYYLIGLNELKDQVHHFRIDRMRMVRMLYEDGKRPAEFNLEQYLKRTWYMYSGPMTKVRVRFNNSVFKAVTERNMSEGKLVEKNDKYFEYEFLSNGTEGILIWLLGFGDNMEVLGPLELREQIREISQNMVKIYE
ncbi:MAG: WYL domain-containing protein [Xylanivirga thermophila]|jgi:predicted DNA-binding transcriptional regulator YafY|uniref:helix-turn-helix transcriptional regulator n=1 Tax=Xylanivirga thermophila TaxID=2496273 RepID=UPI0039F5016C